MEKSETMVLLDSLVTAFNLEISEKETRATTAEARAEAAEARAVAFENKLREMIAQQQKDTQNLRKFLSGFEDLLGAAEDVAVTIERI